MPLLYLGRGGPECYLCGMVLSEHNYNGHAIDEKGICTSCATKMSFISPAGSR